MNSSSQSNFSFVQPRNSVEIHLPGGSVISGPRNAPVGDFLKLLQEPPAGQPASAPIVGAVINGELRELSYPVRMDSRVLPITMADEDGMLFYRRSLTFLLDTAFENLFPDYTLTIDHSVSSGGYYCRVSDPLIMTELELQRLDAQMRELVEQDLPFIRREVPLAEAMAYFKSKGYDDKVRLLSHRQKAHLVLYRLGDHQDYLHGYMVPSTGYLKWFGLALTNGGFTLLFPRRHSPTTVASTPNYPKLLKTFRQYGEWLDRLGIASVGVLNDSIQAGKTSEVVLVSEALHEQNVAEIAAQITERRDTAHIILISGPSSSGKTTFSKRLAIQLLSQGISPFPLEIDNYFVDRELTPRDENGEFDFESLGAVDTTRLVSDLQHLIQGEQVQLPRYNFQQGKSEPGDVVQLQPGQLIILEGIHGLNPDLLPSVSTELTFRIYTSCLTQLNLDRHNRISTTDTRLLRRIVRDARERGYSARDTIQRWESVRRGEKRYIFPYQENADVMFNSALAYDVSVLKPLVEPLLRQVPFGTPEYIEAKRLLALMEWFLPIGLETVPGNSIVREFTGGSILKDFKLWHNQ
ncbi:MAG: nucleoside kinase [Anaerolineales bacterium]|jgi:uridine kinase|nr:nucleoside kinase [Anaerolineales bacterium]